MNILQFFFQNAQKYKKTSVLSSIDLHRISGPRKELVSVLNV